VANPERSPDLTRHLHAMEEANRERSPDFPRNLHTMQVSEAEAEQSLHSPSPAPRSKERLASSSLTRHCLERFLITANLCASLNNVVSISCAGTAGAPAASASMQTCMAASFGEFGIRTKSNC
jgi:hypothetical protein